jgi:hypothetical protein
MQSPWTASIVKNQRWQRYPQTFSRFSAVPAGCPVSLLLNDEHTQIHRREQSSSPAELPIPHHLLLQPRFLSPSSFLSSLSAVTNRHTSSLRRRHAYPQTRLRGRDTDFHTPRRTVASAGFPQNRELRINQCQTRDKCSKSTGMASPRRRPRNNQKAPCLGVRRCWDCDSARSHVSTTRAYSRGRPVIGRVQFIAVAGRRYHETGISIC